MFSNFIYSFFPKVFNNGTMLSALAKAKKTNCLRIFQPKLKMVDFYCPVEPRRTFILGNVLSSRRIKPTMIKRYHETDWHDDGKIEQEDDQKVITLDPDELEVDEKYQNELLLKENAQLKQDNFKKKFAQSQRNSSNRVNFLKEDTKTIEKPVKKLQENKFTQLHENNNLLSNMLRKLKSRKGRSSERKIILEGKRLIHDAISAGYQPLCIFYSRAEDLIPLKISKTVQLYKASYKSLQLWSSVVTTQGVMGVFNMPKIEKALDLNVMPITVICDNIREPGNLGAIIRVVAAVGCEKLILTKGCVDVWDQKVLRSACGSHFRLPILSELEWREIEEEVSEPSHVVLADEKIPEDVEKNDDCSTRRDSFKTTKSNDLPFHYYDSLKYDWPAVIVIGGESHGLSEAAYEFAKQRKGVRACIPMCNEVESMNTAVALAIIAYEIKRQLNVLL